MSGKRQRNVFDVEHVITYESDLKRKRARQEALDGFTGKPLWKDYVDPTMWLERWEKWQKMKAAESWVEKKVGGFLLHRVIHDVAETANTAKLDAAHVMKARLAEAANRVRRAPDMKTGLSEAREYLASKNLSGLRIDENISTQRALVFHDPSTNDIKVVFGDKPIGSFGELREHMGRMLNRNEVMKDAHGIMEKVKTEYGLHQTEVIGHRRAGTVAGQTGSAWNVESTTFGEVQGVWGENAPEYKDNGIAKSNVSVENYKKTWKGAVHQGFAEQFGSAVDHIQNFKAKYPNAVRYGASAFGEHLLKWGHVEGVSGAAGAGLRGAAKGIMLDFAGNHITPTFIRNHPLVRNNSLAASSLVESVILGRSWMGTGARAGVWFGVDKLLGPGLDSIRPTDLRTFERSGGHASARQTKISSVNDGASIGMKLRDHPSSTEVITVNGIKNPSWGIISTDNPLGSRGVEAAGLHHFSEHEITGDQERVFHKNQQEHHRLNAENHEYKLQQADWFEKVEAIASKGGTFTEFVDEHFGESTRHRPGQVTGIENMEVPIHENASGTRVLTGAIKSGAPLTALWHKAGGRFTRHEARSIMSGNKAVSGHSETEWNEVSPGDSTMELARKTAGDFLSSLTDSAREDWNEMLEVDSANLHNEHDKQNQLERNKGMSPEEYREFRGLSQETLVADRARMRKGWKDAAAKERSMHENEYMEMAKAVEPSMENQIFKSMTEGLKPINMARGVGAGMVADKILRSMDPNNKLEHIKGLGSAPRDVVLGAMTAGVQTGTQATWRVSQALWTGGGFEGAKRSVMGYKPAPPMNRKFAENIYKGVRSTENGYTWENAPADHGSKFGSVDARTKSAQVKAFKWHNETKFNVMAEVAEPHNPTQLERMNAEAKAKYDKIDARRTAESNIEAHKQIIGSQVGEDGLTTFEREAKHTSAFREESAANFKARAVERVEEEERIRVKDVFNVERDRVEGVSKANKVVIKKPEPRAPRRSVFGKMMGTARRTMGNARSAIFGGRAIDAHGLDESLLAAEEPREPVAMEGFGPEPEPPPEPPPEPRPRRVKPALLDRRPGESKSEMTDRRARAALDRKLEDARVAYEGGAEYQEFNDFQEPRQLMIEKPMEPMEPLEGPRAPVAKPEAYSYLNEPRNKEILDRVNKANLPPHDEVHFKQSNFNKFDDKFNEPVQWEPSEPSAHPMDVENKINTGIEELGGEYAAFESEFAGVGVEAEAKAEAQRVAARTAARTAAATGLGSLEGSVGGIAFAAEGAAAIAGYLVQDYTAKGLDAIMDSLRVEKHTEKAISKIGSFAAGGAAAGAIGGGFAGAAVGAGVGAIAGAAFDLGDELGVNDWLEGAAGTIAGWF